MRLFRPVVIATKIKAGENLTGEIFYWRKIPDLRYLVVVASPAVLALLRGRGGDGERAVCPFPAVLRSTCVDVQLSGTVYLLR